MGVIETASDLAKLAQKLGNIEVYEQVIALQSQVMELIGTNMALSAEIKPLKEALEKLSINAGIAETLKYEANNYYREVDGTRDGPFCSTCWDVDKTLVRMYSYTFSGQTKYSCRYCTSGARKKL